MNWEERRGDIEDMIERKFTLKAIADFYDAPKPTVYAALRRLGLKLKPGKKPTVALTPTLLKPTVYIEDGKVVSVYPPGYAQSTSPSLTAKPRGRK